MTQCAWKPNWDETRQHFVDWWNRKGLVLGAWTGIPASKPHLDIPYPEPKPATLAGRHTDAVWRARHNLWMKANQAYPADILPIAWTDFGPGTLAIVLGAEPEFSPETVWYHPCWENETEPEGLPPARFDAGNRWWRVIEDVARETAKAGKGKFFTGCPDLIENIDILANLRGTEPLLMDMAERPEWVEKKVEEITAAWFEVYERIHDIIKLEDGSSAFGAFAIWGPGKTAKLQCDASAMISPEMFRRFVAPSLKAQCEWLDHSMFHLDGSQCLCHLDALLSIEALDAIEWTPDPQVPSGGDPHWYDLYRRILAAGKSVQAIGLKPAEVLPLLAAIGTRGVYAMVEFESPEEAEALYREVSRLR